MPAMSTGLVSAPASVRSLPGLVWPPVIAVMLLSWMSSVMLVRWCTALSSPVRPECRKVESPMTASEPVSLPPARMKPCSIGMLAPISTAECMWLTGGRVVRS